MEYADEFDLSRFIEESSITLETTNETRLLILEKTLRKELECLSSDICSKECIEFIQHLMIVDHTKRPSAAEALEHPFVR